MHKIFGLTALQIFATMIGGIVAFHYFGFLAMVVAVLAISGLIQYRHYRLARSEAAWEISEQGTRQLWNDGPKTPMHRMFKP